MPVPCTFDLNSDYSSSINDNSSCFEGPEKTLHLWFSFDDNNQNLNDSHNILTPPMFPRPIENTQISDSDSIKKVSTTKTLLKISKEKWQEMLTLIKAQILSEISNTQCTAYLLSESSLFVFESSLLIKTCGTTTLLSALGYMLELASSVGARLCTLSYSRKQFLYAQHQPQLYRDWTKECAFLDKYTHGFEKDTFSVDGKDGWHTYRASLRALENQTIQIIMTRLQSSALFYAKNKDIGQMLGCKDWILGSAVDDYIFDPCGYSMNALRGSVFQTVHVTPEEECSYASYETNGVSDLNVIINTFLPDVFCVISGKSNVFKGFKLTYQNKFFGGYYSAYERIGRQLGSHILDKN